MRLLLTASTEHLMARDGAHNRFLPCHWFPISSHLVGRLSAHLQICQVTIHILQLLALSPHFCFVSAVLFFFFLSKESSLFQLFFAVQTWRTGLGTDALETG